MNVVIPYRKPKDDREIYLCVDLIKKKYPNKKIYVMGDVVKHKDITSIYVPTSKEKRTRWYDSCNNVLQYIEKVKEPFILWHDDIFITDFDFELENNYYCQTIRERLKRLYHSVNSDYHLRFQRVPQDYKDYEIHIPFIVENVELYKECILEAFENGTTPLVKTIYGNKLNNESDKDYHKEFGVYDSKSRVEFRKPYHSLFPDVDLDVMLKRIKDNSDEYEI